MNKSPDTERDIGITAQVGEKFSDLRHKALLEEKERHGKARRDKQEVVPKFRVGERVVVAKDSTSNSRGYMLIEVLDLRTSGRKDFLYYGLVLKVSSEKNLSRLGRLSHFNDSGNRWGGDLIPANVHEDGVKWLEEK